MVPTSLEHGDYEGTDPAERSCDGAGRGLCLWEEYLRVDGEREGTSTLQYIQLEVWRKKRNINVFWETYWERCDVDHEADQWELSKMRGGVVVLAKKGNSVMCNNVSNIKKHSH